MIDLEQKHLAIVKSILKKQIPTVEVRVFGSRVKGTAKRYSDLDLALMTKEPLTLAQLGDIKDAFSISNLPIMVDVVDWQRISPQFRQVIDQCYEVI